MNRYVFVSLRSWRWGANSSQKCSLGRGESGTKRASVWRVCNGIMARNRAFSEDAKIHTLYKKITLHAQTAHKSH